MQGSGHQARLRGSRVQSVRAVVRAQEWPAQHEVLCRTAAHNAGDADVRERARQLHASNMLRDFRHVLHAALWSHVPAERTTLSTLSPDWQSWCTSDGCSGTTLEGRNENGSAMRLANQTTTTHV